MGLTINNNLEALNASRNLNGTENMLSQAMQRLSSGLKINSAADDVAGYAIAESLKSQVNGLNQASENIQDAVALAQTAQGALNDVNQMLQRIRELAVQYSNGTTSEEDQKAIISEVGQLVDEIKRVGETTQFNGKNLLNAAEEIRFQVGANDGEGDRRHNRQAVCVDRKRDQARRSEQGSPRERSVKCKSRKKLETKEAAVTEK